jgi:hypothetical protein
MILSGLDKNIGKRLLVAVAEYQNMNLEEHLIACPYCGENFTALVDPCLEIAEYVEDCEICCQPIVFSITESGSDSPLHIDTRREND